MATRTLNVEVIDASGLKDTEFIGKSDPYVVVSIGKAERKSKPAKDQAETPAWNETFSLPVADTDTDLLVRILNDDTMGKDEEMARAVVPLSLIHGRSHSASTFPLELKGKPHGEIKMSLSFEGEGAHHEKESHGLAEKVQGLFVGERKEHDHGEGHEVHHEGHHEEHHEGDHEGEGMREKLEGKFEGVKEKKHRKKEKKHRGSGDEGGSSSSNSSEGEKDD